MSIFNCFVCVHVQYWYDALDCAVPKPNRYYAGIRVYEEKADDRTKAICLNSIWLNASRTCLSQTESRKRHIQFSRVSFFQLEFETIYGSYIWTSSSQISAKKARRHNLFLQIVFFRSFVLFFSFKLSTSCRSTHTWWIDFDVSDRHNWNRHIHSSEQKIATAAAQKNKI